MIVLFFGNTLAQGQGAGNTSKEVPLAVLIDLKPRLDAYLKARQSQVNELATKYGRVLDVRLNKAADAGDLKTTDAFQQEKDKLASIKKTLAVLPVDSVSAVRKNATFPDLPQDAPEALIGLREIWTSEWQKIRNKLDPALQQSLKKLESDLTRERKLENAKIVYAYRQSLLSSNPAVVGTGSAEMKPIILSPEPAGQKLMRACAHFVVKGEIDIFINGKKLRYKDISDDPEYIDATSSPQDLGENDIIVIRVKSEAGFRGVIFAFKEEEGNRTIPFSKNAYRLLSEEKKISVGKLDAQTLLQDSNPRASKMNPDPNMNRYWMKHGIPYSQFVRPEGQGVWSTWAIVITPDMVRGE